MQLRAIERKILNCIQKDMPLSPQPFKILSKKLGIEEKEFLRTARRLKEKGIIRNFAAHLNHRKLGFKSTLIGLRMPEDKVTSVAKWVIDYPEVTHCYLREGEYNLWIVFISLEEIKIRKFLNRLARDVGRENVLNLVTRRQFKLNVRLTL